MKRRRYIQVGSLIMVLTILLLGLVGGLIGIPGITRGAAPQSDTNRSINVTIYLTTNALGQIFQNRINQMLSGTIAGSMSKLPAQDRAWALQMATSILQPSASLTNLTPQTDALSATVKVSLYAGDPQPIEARMQISFRVVSPSMVQVSVTPLSGSPSLANGPVATIQVPLGQLSAINTTPTCGDSALAINLQFPISLAQPPTSSGSTSAPSSPAQSQAQGSPVDLSIGLPAPSLDTIGISAGSISINNNMSAKNIHIRAQNDSLNITSDLYMGSFNMGSSMTTVETTASGGNLTMHVLNTSVQLFHVIPFPYDIYNQDLEATLNTKLKGAFTNKFYVTQAAIGSTAQVSCAPSNGLLLMGKASLG